MERSKAPDGVVLSAIWFIIGAVFSLIGAAAIGVFAFPAVLRDVSGDDRYYALAGLWFAVVILGVGGVLDAVAAVALLRLRQWGRWLAIVLAAIGLVLFPIGTVAGVLIIWYMLSEDAKQVFEREERRTGMTAMPEMPSEGQGPGGMSSEGMD